MMQDVQFNSSLYNGPASTVTTNLCSQPPTLLYRLKQLLYSW